MSTTEQSAPSVPTTKKPHWKTLQKQKEAQAVSDAVPPEENPVKAKETMPDATPVPAYDVYPLGEKEQKTFKGHTHTLEVFSDRKLKRFALDHEPDDTEVVRLLAAK